MHNMQCTYKRFKAHVAFLESYESKLNEKKKNRNVRAFL